MLSLLRLMEGLGTHESAIKDGTAAKYVFILCDSPQPYILTWQRGEWP